MDQSKDSLLLFSGGKESVYQLNRRHKQIALLLFFNYGQKSYLKELRSVIAYSQLYKVRWKQIDLPFMILPPAISKGENSSSNVYQRNLVFTSIATHIAEAEGLTKVYLGAVKYSENYDATDYFVEDINRLLIESKVKVVSVSKALTTKQILRSLVKNKVNIAYLWSCDNDVDPLIMRFCGVCSKCSSALRDYHKFKYYEDPYVKRYYHIKYPSIFLYTNVTYIEVPPR